MSSSADYPYAMRCPACGYCHNNGPSNWLIIEPGEYCPKCGRQFDSGDAETKRQNYEVEGLWSVTDDELAYLVNDRVVDDVRRWEFRCQRCDPPTSVEGTRKEVEEAVCAHETETGHFRFDIYYEGDLADGV